MTLTCFCDRDTHLNDERSLADDCSISSSVSVCVWCQAMIGLTMDGKIQQPKYDFDCEEFRYNHRFSQFVCLTTPPPLPYAQYKVDISQCL